MSDITARLDLPLIQPSQAQKHVTHNEALQVLDGLVQAALEETGANTPPFEPVTGTLYAIGPSPTDDWAGEPNKLALRITEAWLFIDPQLGWRAWDKSTEQFKVFDGTGWAEITPDLDNLDGIGINTASDGTNRLAVASAATLLTHEGAGHQLKVNKSADTDTASLLFQSNWTGHAEMGLAGDTAFSVKVSDDGTTWYNALKAAGNSGNVAIGAQPTSDSKLRVVIDQSGPWNTAFERYVNSGGSHNFLFRKARGTEASPVAVQSGDALMSITSSGHDGSDFAAVGVLRFDAETVTGTDISGRMEIVLADTSGNLQARAAIDEAGNMGIGTTTPSTTLDVNGPARVKGYTVAGAPLAADAGPGAIILVNDEAGGAVLAFSDGTDWRRVTDRAVIS